MTSLMTVTRLLTL